MKKNIFAALFLLFVGSVFSYEAMSQTRKQSHPIVVNKKNAKARFSVSGTIRNVVPVKSPYAELSQKAKGWWQISTGSFNSNQWGVIICGRNGFQATDETPYILKHACNFCNKNDFPIMDVHVTEGNKFLFLMDKPHPVAVSSSDAFVAYEIPKAMRNTLTQMQQEQGMLFFGACLNDKGNWSIICNKGWMADEETSAIVEKASSLYGGVISIYMTNNSTIVCCMNGVYCNNVPSSVYYKLLQIDFLPLIVKYTDSGLYLITERDKKYSTNL